MVAFRAHCSRFSSVLLSRSLFSGWLKIYLYLQLSVICGGQKWLARREGLPSAFPLQLAFVSLNGEHKALSSCHQRPSEPGDNRTVSFRCAVCQSSEMAELTNCELSVSQLERLAVSWPSHSCSFLGLRFGNKDCIEFLEVHWTVPINLWDSFWKWKFFRDCQSILIWRFPHLPEILSLDPNTVIFLRLSSLLLSYPSPYKSEPRLWFCHFTKTYTEAHKNSKSH